MQHDINRREASNVPLIRRLLLVLAVWSLALLVLFIWTEPRFPDGLLITALNGDVGLGPVWLQNVVCLFYVVTTSVVLVYSRPKGFLVLYVVLITILSLNLLFILLSAVCSSPFMP